MANKPSPEKSITKPIRSRAKRTAVKRTAIPDSAASPGSIPQRQNIAPVDLTYVSAEAKTNREFKLFLIITGLILIGFYIGTQNETLMGLLSHPGRFFQKTQSGDISAAELKKELANKNFTLINVHVPYEGEIEKTDLFVPFDQIDLESADIPKDKNVAIVLYCKTGNMSSEAYTSLKRLGYTNIRNVTGGMDAYRKTGGKILDLSRTAEEVAPADGKELPVSWGGFGPRLVSLGVIDPAKFREAVHPTDDEIAILTGNTDKKIRIDSGNSQFVVDVLWALGLAQKSIVYEQGPMGKEYKKDAAGFASTGGWTLARGDAMAYYNTFDLIPLTPDQQKQVYDISKNIYRPCCGNPTSFPDCNHGMAALAAIELMVSAGIPEREIYKNILALNSYWFTDTYTNLAVYFGRQGLAWKDVDAKMILGQDYSSAQGASRIANKLGTLPYGAKSQGDSCGT